MRRTKRTYCSYVWDGRTEHIVAMHVTDEPNIL